MARARIAVAGILLFLLSLAAPLPGASAEALMDWSQPLQLDSGSSSQFTSGAGIDCAGADFCVAVGDDGRLLVSADPTAGREGWDEVQVGSPPVALTAVSCPSEDFCAIADAAGNLLTSAEPRADAAAWSSAPIDPGHEIVSVSCPSTGFCAAVDDADQVLVSEDPDSGAAAWSAGTAFTGEAEQISCAGAALCALAYDGSNPFHEPPGLLISTDPLAGPASWADSGLDLGEGGGEAFGVSCPTATFCGFAYHGGILVSSEPAGGSSTWHLTHSVSEGASPGLSQLEYGEGLGIACPSAGFCVAQLNYPASQNFYPAAPRLLFSSQPTIQGSWTFQTMNREWDFGRAGMVCTGPAFCATVGGSGLISTSTEPAGGSEAWKLALAPPKGPALTSVACPAGTFCAATGTDGRLYTSTDPADPGGWTATRLAELVESVTCSSPSWCTVAADGPVGHTVMYSTDPGAGAGAWSAVARRTGRALTCPEPDFCAQLADYDEVLATDEPLAGLASWTVTDMELPDWRLGPNELRLIDCPAADLCVTAGDAGRILASPDPSGGVGAWVGVSPGDGGIGGLSCPSASFCAVTMGAWAVATTTDPLGPSAWTRSDAHFTHILGPISCAGDASLCVAIDQDGDAVTSRSPQSEPFDWGNLEPIYEGEGLRDVSCALDGSLCAAISREGEMIVGTPRPPSPGGEGSMGGGGPAPSPNPSEPPPARPSQPCRKAKPRKHAKRGPAIAPRRRVNSAGRRSKSRCARPR